MEFRILGPVEVRVDERTAAIGGTKQRTLLGVLLLHANEVVSSERLVAELWGMRPPPSASKLIQTYVGALRKALGPFAVVTQPPGYLISAGEGELDALRFRRLLTDARSEPDLARGTMLLREALSLWRGNALADVGFEGPAAIEAERLDELRLDAVALRVERDLALGRHAQLVGELQSLVEAHPLRERLRALLMLALYRSGRQAEALGVYAATSRLLDSELGLEPSEELRRLERQVLVHDSALELEPVVAPVRATPTPPADAPAAHDLRKTVTVLFADVTNFTSFGEGLDPETLRATMSRYFDTMRAAIERHGGTVEKFVGDEVMAVFGVPVAREDDALRAVRAAVDMRSALAALNHDFALAGVEIEARTGINTGTVVAGDVSAGYGFVTGDPVNVGKRLEQAAGAGEILLGASTFTLVRHAVETEAVGPLALKGKAAAVPAYRLARLIEGAPGFARHLEAPLVGRAGELEQLHAAFRHAVDERRCTVATVIGEAGIGKTRLVNELVAGVGDLATMLVGRCVADADGATFLPLQEILVQAPEEVDEEAGAARRALDTACSTNEIFLAFRQLLEAVAARRPVLLVLEDVHWAEPTFLDLIEYLGGWIVDAPVAVVCLARPELLDARASWPAPIRLAALSAEDSAVLLANLEQGTPALNRSSLVETAEGNPLYLEQLLAYMSENGDGQDDMPQTIDALLAARLDRLDPDSRIILERAAVVGRTFWRGAVQHLSPPQARDGVIGGLLSLVRSGLVDPDRSLLAGEDAFRFHHVLIRDAAYRAIPKRMRSELHERCADWLAALPGEQDELVGYHLEQAHRARVELRSADEATVELGTRAGERLAAAGHRARGRFDTTAALNLLERAVSLLPGAHQARPEAVSDLIAVRNWSGGDPAEVESLIAGAIDRARRASDPRWEMVSRLQRAWIEVLHGLAPTEDVATLAGQALAVFEDLGDARGLAMAWKLRAQTQANRCRLADATDSFARAVDHAREADDRFEEAEAFAGVNMSLAKGPMPLEQAIPRLRGHLTVAADKPTMQASTLGYLSSAEALRGQFEDAREHYRRGYAIAYGLGQNLGAAGSTIESGMRELLAGELEAAEAELRFGCDELERLGLGAATQPHTTLLAEVMYRQGRYREAERFVALDEPWETSVELDVCIARGSVRAKLLARRGRTAEAVALASETAARAAQTDALQLHGDVLIDLAEVLRLAEDEAGAVEAVAQALELYERKGSTVLVERARELLAAMPRSARVQPVR
jgi:class 3 adenylate cyclase